MFKNITLMEDIEIINRIKKAKEKIFIIPKKIKTSPRRWDNEGVVHCTLRNWYISFLYFIGINLV